MEISSDPSPESRAAELLEWFEETCGPFSVQPNIQTHSGLSPTSPVEKLRDVILLSGRQKKASHVLLVPTSDSLFVFLKIGGALVNEMQPPRKLHKALVESFEELGVVSYLIPTKQPIFALTIGVTNTADGDAVVARLDNVLLH